MLRGLLPKTKRPEGQNTHLKFDIRMRNLYVYKFRLKLIYNTHFFGESSKLLARPDSPSIILILNGHINLQFWWKSFGLGWLCLRTLNLTFFKHLVIVIFLSVPIHLQTPDSCGALASALLLWTSESQFLAALFLLIWCGVRCSSSN